MIKKKLYDKCMELLNIQRMKYSREIEMIKESLEGGCSQSADDEGSKNELLNDIEKYAKYIENTENLKNQLSKIDVLSEYTVVTSGSLVETENNFFFITVALGKIEINDKKNYYSISVDAPIYAHLKGKKAGDSFSFNNINYKILRVY